MDHTHYARWLPVHLRDMVQLEHRHPSVYTQFMLGHFTVEKSSHRFSSITLDHNHEQLNQLIKGDGGAVGLTENPSALLRWMVAGPEIARAINEFDTTHHKYDTKHHGQSNTVQEEFKDNVKEMVNLLKEMENPFLMKGHI